MCCEQNSGTGLLRLNVALTVTPAILCLSCLWRTHVAAFRVVPAAPNYLLRYPDSIDAAFPDVLRVYNGFEPGRGWMDLRSDMQLRIENAYYEPGMPRHGLNGFLGTEVAHLEVRANGTLQFTSVQPMNSRPGDQLPVTDLVQAWQRQYGYHRFYYEILFKRSGNSRGSVLLGAESPDDLTGLAKELQTNPDSVCNDSSTHCTVFPEACSVSIEMNIVVNKKPQTVIWGTPLSRVVEHATSIQLQRLYKGRLVPVHLDADDPEALSLPLLPDDHLTWR